MPDQNGEHGLTFRDLVVCVARLYGVADPAGNGMGYVVPSDPNNLAFCVEIVRQGVRRVATDHPRWRWMRQRISLTLQAGKSEYRMPWFFDGRTLSERLTYDASGPRGVVSVISEPRMREMIAAVGEVTGDPSSVCFYQGEAGDPRPAPVGQASQRRWTAWFAPTPTQTRTVQMVVRANVRNAFDLDDFHPAGPALDALMESACRAAAEMEAGKGETQYETKYQSDLRAAIAVDEESGPRNLGTASDPEAGDDDTPPTSGPLYLNGVRVL